MKKTILIIVLATLCLNFRAWAQNPSGFNQIQIGDTIPDFTFNNVVNYPKKFLSFSDFKGKNIIIDFWATYCGSCLAHFKLSDSLQQQYEKDLQIILVDGPYKSETTEKIISVIRKYDSRDHKFLIPSIINDKILIPSFPHKTIPHYVWIDRERKVRAITSGEDLTRENVRKFLAENQVPEYTKKDFDHKKPLYSSDDLPLNNLEEYSIFLKGNIEGIGNGGIREINGVPRGINLHNRPLIDMYLRLRSEIVPGPQDSRLLLEVKDSSQIMYLPKYGSRAEWIKANRYSYELIVPRDKMNHLYEYVIEDLNRYTPFIINVEKRRELCWKIIKLNDQDLLATKGGAEENNLDDPKRPQLTNQPMYSLLIFLTKYCGQAYVIDNTGYLGNIDLRFKSSANSLGSINENLKPYGLKIISEYQNIDMMVVRDKQNISILNH